MSNDCEPMRTKDPGIRHILNLETCISVVAAFFYGVFMTKVKQDKKFSGKYVIAGLKHTYKRSGITTDLELVRDSLPRSGNE